MRRLLRKFAICLAVVTVTLSLSPGTAAAAGRRIVNGDGDTAGKCLTQDRFVWLRPCGQGGQGWRYQDVGGGLWEIRLVSDLTGGDSGCLHGVPHGFTMRLNSCNGVDEQRWIKIAYSPTWSGWVNLEYSSLCLDAAFNGTSEKVQLWDCADLGSQKWKLV